MKFRIIGQSNDSGIGTHYQNYTTALKQIGGINQILEFINFQDNAAVHKAAQESQPNDINLGLVICNLNNFFQGVNINWGVFESTRIPNSLIGSISNHNLWVPSEWGRNIAIENGCDKDKIEVVHEGVDGSIFHPYLKFKENRPFRFLFIGKSEIRKSIIETLTAFANEFGNNDKFELLVKSDFFRNPTEKYNELTQIIKDLNCSNIKLIWGHQTLTEMSNLYRRADVFIFPTKAEGWGLPLIEAAACGLPLITTFYSGHTEFLKDITSSCINVPYDLKEISCPEYQEFYPDADGNFGKWAVPTIQDIRTCMRKAYDDYATLSEYAVKNSEIVRTKYSWANSAVKSLEVLKKRNLL
jgi:hypothetical protein